MYGELELSRISAIFIIIIGAFFMSFVGLIMQVLETSNGFLILFYRSIGLSIIVGSFVCLRRRISPLTFLKSLDSVDSGVGLLLTGSFMGYIFAMLYTSVASTLFILSVTPFLAALIAWAWIGEKPKLSTWFSMLFAICGVLIMLRNGLNGGGALGNSFAFLSAICFAVMLVFIRRSKRIDVLGGTFLGGIFSCVFGFIASILINQNLYVSPTDLILIILMGAFTIGIGVLLVTWGSTSLPPAEVSLLVLTETILGPIWPWIFLGQAITLMEGLGGISIFVAILILLFSNRNDNSYELRPMIKT
ncbi:MAG: DME family drug/metabolite transporter [Paracoccaceae bacterium]|jgi:DME family drug/metabolite transporter